MTASNYSLTFPFKDEFLAHTFTCTSLGTLSYQKVWNIGVFQKVAEFGEVNHHLCIWISI